MPSYLSNYDPSAFHAGLQWAAQQEQYRQQTLARQQQEEFENQRQAQEFELQRRNRFAELAEQNRLEMERTQRQQPIAWRTDRANNALAQAQETITANWNTAQAYDVAERSEPGTYDPDDVKANQTYMKGLQDAAQTTSAKVSQLDPTQASSVWADPKLGGAIPDISAPPQMRYSKAYLDKQAAEQKAIDDEAARKVTKENAEITHLRAETGNIGNQIANRNQRTAILKQKAAGGGNAKLDPQQSLIFKGALGALNSYGSFTKTTPGATYSDAKGNKVDLRSAHAGQFLKNAPLLTRALKDPAIAAKLGLDPTIQREVSDDIDNGAFDPSNVENVSNYLNKLRDKSWGGTGNDATFGQIHDHLENFFTKGGSATSNVGGDDDSDLEDDQ